MKKTTSKFLSLIIVLTMVMSLGVINAVAHSIGDVINYARPTDIVASINGYQIMSYNVDGLTYICVEDLRHYGFDVIYDNNTRSLSVGRSSAATIAPHISNSAEFWKIGSNKTAQNILYTDIVTYVNGNAITSYNIDGRTIIGFNDLAAFGEVSYNNDKREITLFIQSLEYNAVAKIIDIVGEEEAAGLEPTYNEMAKDVYGNFVSVDVKVRAKGNIIVYEMYLKGIILNPEQRRAEQEGIEETMPIIKENYQPVKENFPDIAGVAFVLYDGSGQEVASATTYLD